MGSPENFGSVIGVYLPSPLGGLLFSLCFGAWVIFEAWVNLKTWPAQSSNRDQLSRYVIIAAVWLSLALAVAATGLHR